MRQCGPGHITQNVWNHPHPAPRGDVRDRIPLSKQEGSRSQLGVQDGVMPPGLVFVPVEGVLLSSRSVVPEMHRLAGIGADPTRDEHEPRKQITARLLAVTGKKLTG